MHRMYLSYRMKRWPIKSDAITDDGECRYYNPIYDNADRCACTHLGNNAVKPLRYKYCDFYKSECAEENCPINLADSERIDKI